jgi:glycosyltransferase involved in cell wall biosynthesis
LPFEIRIKTVLMVAACDVSVIVPSLNEGKYLRRCLKSLVRQSSRRIAEIIVVDGGSRDGTIEAAEEYADKVLVEPARPVGAARNIGAKQAEGEILAFIDADTVASKDWVEQIALALDSKPWAVGVTGPTLPYEGTHLDRIAYHVATGWVQRFSFRLGRPHVAGFNCAYRKRAFWDAGGFDEDRVLLEDVMLSLRMRHHGRIIFNPHMIAHTSLRRINRYGYPYLMTYNAINWIVTLLFNQTLAYPQIR